MSGLARMWYVAKVRAIAVVSVPAARRMIASSTSSWYEGTIWPFVDPVGLRRASNTVSCLRSEEARRSFTIFSQVCIYQQRGQVDVVRAREADPS